MKYTVKKRIKTVLVLITRVLTSSKHATPFFLLESKKKTNKLPEKCNVPGLKVKKALSHLDLTDACPFKLKLTAKFKEF